MARGRPKTNMIMSEGQDKGEVVSDDDIKRRFEATADLIREMAVAAEERHDKEMGEIRAELRRAVRLSVEEARRERVRRQEADERLDGYITKLAAAQLETDHSLQLLIHALRPGGNGGQDRA
jgi:hypothetical protein